MPGPTPCWCSTSTRELAATSAEDFVGELLGRADRRGGGGHRRRLHLRQGPRRQCRGAARAWARRTASPPKRSAPVLLDGRADLVGPHPRGAGRRRPAHRDPPADPPVRDRRRGPARRQARPRARLSDRQPAARRLPAARLRHLRGPRAARRRERACRGRQPRHPPDLRAAASNCSKPICSTSTSDLYGRTIEVALHHFLRPEAKFDDLDALTAQMRERRGRGAAA